VEETENSLYPLKVNKEITILNIGAPYKGLYKESYQRVLKVISYIK
jgi:hypothetical protein